MIVILDNIRSAHNVGSIIRTCDAFGIKELYLCGITPGADNPKVKKTSLGAEKNILSKQDVNTIDAVKALIKEGYQIVALELTDRAIPISEYMSNEKIALVVGNEVSGVSSDVMDLASEIVMIPMQGIKESLNVSVAFGIAAYEILSHKKDL